jgi:hypothetical protein
MFAHDLYRPCDTWFLTPREYALSRYSGVPGLAQLAGNGAFVREQETSPILYAGFNKRSLWVKIAILMGRPSECPHETPGENLINKIVNI